MRPKCPKCGTQLSIKQSFLTFAIKPKYTCRSCGADLEEAKPSRSFWFAGSIALLTGFTSRIVIDMLDPAVGYWQELGLTALIIAVLLAILYELVGNKIAPLKEIEQQ